MENFSVFIAKHMGLFYTFAATLIALMIIEAIRAKRGRARVRPADAVLMINKHNAIVVDIRSNDNFRKGHIIDAVSVPVADLINAEKRLNKYKSNPLIVVDSTGNDSQKAADALARQGYNAFILSGGLRAWSSADLPIVKE